MQQRTARVRAVAILALLLAGCAGSQETVPEAIVTTQSRPSPVAINLPEEFLLPLPMGVRAVDLTISGLGRNLAIVREKKAAHIGGLLDPEAARVMVSTSEDNLRVAVQGQGNSPDRAAVIKLPVGLPLRLQMTGGSQSLFIGMAGLEVTSLSIAGHQGDVYVVLPEEPGTTVHIAGGEGKLTLEVPAGSPAMIDTDHGELYRSPAYKGENSASLVTIRGWKGPVKVQGN